MRGGGKVSWVGWVFYRVVEGFQVGVAEVACVGGWCLRGS